VSGLRSAAGQMAGLLLDFIFRFRVALAWTVGICGFVLARPSALSILIGSVWAGIGLGWRAWAAGNICKNVEMATAGPYALSRHPLYFGNLMLACGFGAASGRVIVFAAISLLALGIFVPLMRREEAAMLDLFGERYRQYMRAVPPLVPALRRASWGGFSWRQYLANHEYNAAIGYCAAVGALIAIHRSPAVAAGWGLRCPALMDRARHLRYEIGFGNAIKFTRRKAR